jgi:hypothetical protein
MHYLLIYDVVPDYVNRRAAPAVARLEWNRALARSRRSVGGGGFRDEHLGLAWQAQERGDLVLGGALADPVDGRAAVLRRVSRNR